MSRGSVIVFGISIGVLLIFSCISLNASKFYNDLAAIQSENLNSKPHIVLRDRSF